MPDLLSHCLERQGGLFCLSHWFLSLSQERRMEIKVRVSCLFWDDFIVSGHFKAAEEIGNGLAYHIPNII